MEAAPCKVIGITGSAGKTTTTMLVGRMCEAGVGRLEVRELGVRESPNSQPLTPNSPPATRHSSPTTRSWVGGNIGNPLIVSIDEMSADDIAVMELSSFQLEIMTHSPQVAAVLNVTPNHLDRHLTMDAYTAAKARILDYQTADDVAVLGRDDPGAWELADSVRGGLVSFGIGCPPAGQSGTFLRDEMIALWDGQSAEDLFPRKIIGLRGEHNLLNVLAACAIACAIDLPVEAMRVGVEGFKGVEHRLEFVRSWGGADWYNNSIATAPERVMAAIRSFDEPLVLLAGGRDKDLPWDDFAALVRQRVDHVILFGEASEKVAQALGTIPNGSRPFSVSRCEGLQAAVQAAAEIVKPGDVVLLSPGGTSFDEYRDFAERGEWFRLWVNNLP